MDDTGRTDFSCKIKVWLNKLILEVRRQFPAFRTAMRILFIGKERSVDGDNDEEVIYDINAKISETTELFTDAEIKAPGVKIRSIQIQRVLSKWVTQLKNSMAQAGK